MPTLRPSDPPRRQMLASMILVRAFEDRLSRLAAEKEGVLGMQILATGQEAAAVASVQALSHEDVIVSNHRSHGHLLARGADPKVLMAEIMGKAAGVNKGKSGTLHLIVPEVNALMTSTVVGAGPSMAAGAAFAQQYRDERTITAVFFGDGAAAEGNVHEAMNLASVWKLPLLFICENNCWAGAQALKEHCAVGNIAVRAASYGMPGKLVNGNDADEVFSATAELVEHCRSGKGPALLEAYTYRMRGHGEHDHQHYVDKEELELWAAKDPIRTYRERLIQGNLLSEKDVQDMAQDADAHVEEAVRFAAESPFPAPEAALEHVWVQNPWAGR